MFAGADPCVILAGDTYYLYCTSENSDEFAGSRSFYTRQEDGSDGIFAYSSNDLKHWKKLGLCLNSRDVTGERWFWSPDVSYHGGKYYMIYTADEHIAAAVSESPEGPFVQPGKQWLREEPSIDGHLFEDDDGTVYLYYVRLHGGNLIYVAKMADDLLSIDTDYDICVIKAELDWETADGNIVESPWMIKHNGLYYLTYSANHTRSADYCVGCAVSESPLGPFRKYGKPILHGAGELRGTGGQGFFTAKDGTLVCVYHCHNSPGHMKPRRICVNTAGFVPSPEGGVVPGVNESSGAH